MDLWVFPALGILSILCAFKTTCGFNLLKEKEVCFSTLCIEKRMYFSAVVWLVFYMILWLGFGKSSLFIRTFDLLSTYIILAIVDGKCRIVPDSILAIYFAGQMLMGILSMPLAVVIQFAATGVLFTLIVFIFTWLSKGKIGMGDAKLLGVTAVTAGAGFVFQIIIIAVALSFLYSIYLVLFCKKSIKTEFPFVPFLTAAMAVYMVFLAWG